VTAVQFLPVLFECFDKHNVHFRLEKAFRETKTGEHQWEIKLEKQVTTIQGGPKLCLIIIAITLSTANRFSLFLAHYAVLCTML